jgi:hypothetical protein
MYYVYLHRRSDDNSVFYVGKGTKNRAWTKHCRNKYWKNIVNSVGYSVELVYYDLKEDEAFRLEIEQIALYKPSCNFTKGGDGGAIRLGMKTSPETRRKQSEAAKGRIVWEKGKKRPPFTKEHKEKLRMAKLGKKRPDLVGKTGPKRRKDVS